jgi:hypothetical protein
MRIPLLVVLTLSVATTALAPSGRRLQSAAPPNLQAPERSPLDIARVLAARYPAQPIMSYIPALSWSGSFRLAALTGEDRWKEKPRREMQPFLSGATPAIAEPYQLASLAGHLAFADADTLDGNAAAAALAQKAADFILPQSAGEVVRFPRKWTDDMFMATSVLARVGAATRDPKYGAAAGRLLTSYAESLQRPDGIFIHALEGPYAWGAEMGSRCSESPKRSPTFPAPGPTAPACWRSIASTCARSSPTSQTTAAGGRSWTSPPAIAS